LTGGKWSTFGVA